MFRLGVLSDTHGDVIAIRDAACAMGEVNALAFLGDCVSDLAAIRGAFNVPIYAVAGNCDMFCDEPRESVIELEGKRLLLCHGHHWRVKLTYQLLCYHALELKCDAALFGHTHSSYSGYDGGVLLFNPGAASGRAASCGVLEFRPNGMSPRVLSLR